MKQFKFYNDELNRGYDFWEKNEFKKALKCFKLVASENRIIENLLKTHQFHLKVSNSHVTSIGFSIDNTKKFPKVICEIPFLRKLYISWTDL